MTATSFGVSSRESVWPFVASCREDTDRFAAKAEVWSPSFGQAASADEEFLGKHESSPCNNDIPKEIRPGKIFG